MSPSKKPLRARKWIIALVALATVLTLVAGIGTSGAESLSLSEPGTLGAETGNRFCYNFDTSGASSTENLSYAVTSGALPTGIVIASHTFGAAATTETRWALAGTPTGATSTFEITVTDDMGTGGTGDDTVDTASFTIDIGTEATADVVIAAGRFGSGYTIDCDSQAREVQGALRTLGNFGPGGTVGERVAIRNHTFSGGGGAPIDATYLTGVDILMDGWVDDTTWTGNELDLIADFVQGGGVLIATEDRNVADAIGERLGAPTDSNLLCNHTPSELGDPITACPVFTSAYPNHPVVAGPFGDWNDDELHTSGSVGQYDVDPVGWTVIARDPGGQATVISRRIGAGRAILLTDEGLLRTESYGSGFANDIFVKNLIAYAMNPDETPVAVNDTVAGTVGVVLSHDLCANDISTGDTPITVTITGSLPTGVTLTGCTLGGTPTAAGTTNVSYDVTDADGDSDEAAVVIEIDVAAKVRRCKGKVATIVGTAGDDTIRGTSGDDVIVTLSGDDVVRGRGGNDTICGGSGDDIVLGNGGKDAVYGQNGDDTVKGGKRADKVFGGNGADELAGNGGKPDFCKGGPGQDTFLNGCERRKN